MGQRRLDRSRAIRSEEEIRRTKAKESETQELGEESLILETSGTEEKAVEGLKTALEIEAEEEGKDEIKGGGGCAVTQRSLIDLELLTQDAEPSEITLTDARNGFNKLSRLAMLWTVRHRWPEGARFTLNCYRHWAQLLLHQPGEPPVQILSREGVTQV